MSGEHVIDYGYNADDRKYHPTCSCGRWSIPATRFHSAVLADSNQHLARHGAAKLQARPGTWGARYRRKVETHGGFKGDAA